MMTASGAQWSANSQGGIPGSGHSRRRKPESAPRNSSRNFRSRRADFRAKIESRSGKLKPDNLLWHVVLDHVDDYDFMMDDVVLIETSAIANWTKREPNDAAPVAERMAQHLLYGDFGDRGFDVVNKHLNWIKAVLEALGDMNRNDLFEDVATPYCEAVASRNRFRTTTAFDDGFRAFQLRRGTRWHGQSVTRAALSSFGQSLEGAVVSPTSRSQVFSRIDLSSSAGQLKEFGAREATLTDRSNRSSRPPTTKSRPCRWTIGIWHRRKHPCRAAGSGAHRADL